MDIAPAKYPRDFLACGLHIGIKPNGVLDFGAVHSLAPCSAWALFTRNNFPGAPVIVGREIIGDGKLQTVIVNSGNSNVATGEAGLRLVREYCALAAENLGVAPEMILPSSTGVIGRRLPADPMKSVCGALKSHLKEGDFPSFSRAIMTTDTAPKYNAQELASGVRLYGTAKGAGMIQPDMATMLAYVFTDAVMDSSDIQRLLRCVADRTFNRVSIDSDTSTSDTLALLANGASGKRIRFSEAAERAYRDMDFPLERELGELADLDEDSREFTRVLGDICLDLTRRIAREGEGSSRLIELRVTEARDREQALKIGRAVINSPLFKTAVRGADPNWGRIVMAAGKVFDEPLSLESFRIFFGSLEMQLGETDPEQLRLFSEYLANPEVMIRLSLGTGEAEERLWGCDLTEEYVKINAYYTT